MEQRNRLHTESSRGKTPRIKLHDCITKLKRAIAGMVEHMSVSIEKKKEAYQFKLVFDLAFSKAVHLVSIFRE